MLPWICEVMQARGARQVERIQRLWSGYGEIVRVALDGGLAPSVVVKRVAPPGHAASISDARKRRSYAVEETFYRHFAPRCRVRVARMFASKRDAAGWLFVLEDLDAAGFALRGGPLDPCLAWLAGFHAGFLGDAGEGLWPEGTYWHLATRMDELAIEPRRAHALDRALAGARFQTILHGDAKEENFCFSRTGVAAVDFQYAGRGCGMKDVAYLLHGHDDTHLDTYFRHLRAAAGDIAGFGTLEREWRALYPIAQQDFQRFLAGWRGAQ